MSEPRRSYLIKVDERHAQVELVTMRISGSHLRPGRREGDDILADPVTFHAVWLEDEDGFDHELTLDPGLFDAQVGDQVEVRLLTDGRVIRFLSVLNRRTAQRITVNALSRAVVDCHLTETSGEMVGRISLAALGSLAVAYMLSLLYVLGSWLEFGVAAGLFWAASSAILLASRYRRVGRWVQAIASAPDVDLRKPLT